METFTGIMIAILIFYSGRLIINEEIDINNFFSFLAAMMLAYQPVRSLATITMAVNQGLSAARRILPIIDNDNEIADKENAKDLREIPDQVKNGLEIIPLAHVSEVLDIALTDKPQPIEWDPETLIGSGSDSSGKSEDELDGETSVAH